MKGGDARARVVAAGACALALSCAAGGGRLPPEPELRIWVPPVVRWEPGGTRELRFGIENGSNHTVALTAPDPVLARVDVYSGSEDDWVCGTAPPPGDAAAGPRVEIAPGDVVELVVDLARACRGVPPGEYRFVVSYRAPPPGPGAKLWAGALPARHGSVVVERASAEARTPPCPPERPQRTRGAAPRGRQTR